MARILSLADGTVTLLPRGIPAEAAVEVTLADFMPRRRRRAAPYIVPGEARVTNLSEGYINALGDSLERLASMTLARKLRSPAPISSDEAALLVGLAGVPNTRGGQMLTERILMASAEELGKGGFIGQISKAVSQVAKKVITPIAKMAQVAAPLLKNIPVIGPAMSTAVSMGANATMAVAGGSLKSLTSGGVMGLTQRVVGWAGAGAGAVAAEGGAVMQGIMEAPQSIATAGQWIGQEAQDITKNIGGYLGGASGSGGFFNSIVQGGKSLASSFDSSFHSTIEASNPALSGQTTAIFKGLGSTYDKFQGVFDTWSSKLKASAPGTAAVGKIDGKLYSMVKDLTGNVQVTQTPMENAPSGTTSLPDGSLTSASQLAGLGVSQAPGGSGYGPGYSGSVAGMETNPAGVSLPGGPISFSQDPTSMALLNQAARDANAGKSPAAMLAGVPMWAVAGLGVAALAAVLLGGRGQGPMLSMGQGWQRPARRARRSSRRR
jgi:hypothetical protein